MMVAGALTAVLLLSPASSPASCVGDTLPPIGVVQGQLVTRNGEWVPRASLELVPGGGRTLSDPQGTFRLTGVGTGAYVLYVRALGMQPRYLPVVLEPGTGWRGQIILQYLVYELPEVEVRAGEHKPARYAATHKYDDYYRRKKLGFGTFLDREEIEKRHATSNFQLLQGIPGISVSWNPPGSPRPTTLRIARCPQQPPSVAVYVDGMRINIAGMNGGSAPPGSELTWIALPYGAARPGATSTFRGPSFAERLAEVIEALHPNDVEMLEVYQGVAGIPGDFDRDVCAVISLWTRWNPAK